MPVEKIQQSKWETLTAEQKRHIEDVILLKPKIEWSDEEFALFSEYFINEGYELRGIKYLMRERPVRRYGNLIVRRALREQDAPDIVWDWYVGFQASTKFDPGLGLSFKSYFLCGLDSLVLNKQRLLANRIVDPWNVAFGNDEDGGEDHNDELADDKTLPQDELVKNRERRKMLFNLINRLRNKPTIPKYERHARALELRLSGYSYSQIASEIGEKEGYIKALISRAKEYITEDFKNLEDSGMLHILLHAQTNVGGKKL